MRYMDIPKLFTEHPASVGETYFQHMGRAVCFATRMILSGLACMVHAVLPFMFVKTGSETIAELNGQMVVHRSKGPRPRAVNGERLPS